jgi:hypothetical protein
MQLKHDLSSDGRAWVNEVWEAVDGLCSKPLVSPTLIALGPRLSGRYAAAEQLEGDEIQQAFFSVITAGYATRAVLARSTEQPELDSSSLPISSPSDLERNKAVIDEAIDPVESVACEDFESLMTLPHRLWSAYASLAAMHLQERLVSSTLTWYELSAERIEAMLRQGYVVRCLDESLDRKPALRQRG